MNFFVKIVDLERAYTVAFTAAEKGNKIIPSVSSNIFCYTKTSNAHVAITNC